VSQLQLEIISQEKHLLSKSVLQVTAPASVGEVTILPGHIPFFTRLNDGIVIIKTDSGEEDFAILGGFMDVGPDSTVTIMADAAFSADSINEAKALEAKKQAEIALEQKQSEIDFRQTEASLRKAILELKLARRHKHSGSLPSTG
jgi:F-type H+-transporting ATPase subunit epsilon